MGAHIVSFDDPKGQGGFRLFGSADVINVPVGHAGSDAIPILLPNLVNDINLAPTGTPTTIVTVPSTAFAQAPGYLRNEGTIGDWIISFGGNTPTSTSHSVRIGPGDGTVNFLGEAYKEMNIPIGTVKAYHTNPGAGSGIINTINFTGISTGVGSAGPLAPDSHTGTGTGATFNFTWGSGNYTVAIVTAGTGYNVGDQLTFQGSHFGGANGTNDVVVTVSSITGAGRLSGYVAWNDGTSPLAGPIGQTGLYGGPVTLDYKFNNSTSNADPGVGLFALNNATENAATALYIDLTSFDGVTATGILDNLLVQTTTLVYMRIVKKSDVTKWLLFQITAETTHSGYREYAITNVASSAPAPFVLNDECLLAFGFVGNVYSRTTTTLVTGTLTPAQQETGSLTCAKTVAISKVVASDFCRIELYSTAAARTADAARPSTVIPPINTQHGVITDLVLDTSDKLTWVMSPLAYGANVDTSPVQPILYYRITNLSANTESISITFTFTSEEF